MHLEVKPKKQVKPYHGIIVFAITIIFLLLVAAPIQFKWGMYGVAMTEVGLLIIGLIPVIIFKIDLKEVLPIRKPRIRELIGIIVLWIGSYLTVLIISSITQYLFPEFSQVSTSLQETFTSVPMAISLFIIAFL